MKGGPMKVRAPKMEIFAVGVREPDRTLLVSL